jgi:pimeloyl-ACP methyl ester carboxylesterase
MPLPSRLPEASVIREAVHSRSVLYLHGFASSSRSTKAKYFAGRLEAHGVPVVCPDFNVPDFRTLTMTRMLEQLTREVARAASACGHAEPRTSKSEARHLRQNAPGVGPRRQWKNEPVTLFGSSLGGTLAVLAAARLGSRVDRLVLLAPAVMFAKPGHHLLPPERIADWRRAGALPFFHHAYNDERLLDFAFYEDSLRYDVFDARFLQPTIIFQGLRDQSVDHRTVEQFARNRSNVTLSLLDDDHQLIASLPRIWNEVEAFMGLR